MIIVLLEIILILVLTMRENFIISSKRSSLVAMMHPFYWYIARPYFKVFSQPTQCDSAQHFFGRNPPKIMLP